MGKIEIHGLWLLTYSPGGLVNFPHMLCYLQDASSVGAATGLSSTPLHSHTDITVAQTVLLIKAFMIRHCLSNIAVGDLLSMITMLLPVPSKLPLSYHSFSKLFPDISNSVHVHYYCKNDKCMSPVDSLAGECEKCKTAFVEQENKKAGQFFLTLDLKFQIREALEIKGVGDCLITGNKLCMGQMHNIMDGTFVRSIPDLNTDDPNLCLVWNCDGVPLFKSSEHSLWPIRCLIGNLPHSISIQHMLIAGIWFGKSKPCMHTYLQQFVDDMTDVNQSGGVNWSHPSTNALMVSKVFPVICSSDAAARCMLQGIQQYNGENGCSWCLDPGRVVPKGRGYTRTYHMIDPQPRTHKALQLHGIAVATSGDKHIMGVKTLSPLNLLEGFDMVRSFTVDYMHCVLLGCVRQFLDLWLNSKYHDHPWYIGTKLGVIDRKLLVIRPPCDIKRTPRSAKRAQSWKASECYNWLLYYSLFVLDGILPTQYVKHWLLLVDAIYYLLGESLNADGIALANRKLCCFAAETGSRYGDEHTVYNVHQLAHISQCAVECGPLWLTSAFPFEGHNQNLLKLFSGTTYVPHQIAHAFMNLASLPSLLKTTITDSISNSLTTIRVVDTVGQWLKGYPLTSHVTCANDVITFGRPAVRSLTAIEEIVLRPLHSDLNNYEFYDRVLIRGKVFCTESYGKKLKTNSYHIELESGSICKVLSFVLVKVKPTDLLFVMGQLYNTSMSRHSIASSASNVRVVYLSDTIIAVKSSDILKKCVVIGKLCYDKTLDVVKYIVASQPNVLEKQ